MPSLGNDLASLRKKQDLSIEDVKRKTRIPVHILQSIEDDSILDNMENNVTYTRSYVRSYAKAIGVKEEEIVHALDMVERGAYDGSLAESESASAEPDDTGTAEEASADTSGQPEEPDQGGSSPEKHHPPVSSKTTKSSSHNWDWVQVGQQAKTSSSGSGRTAILIILILIAIAAAGYVGYIYYYDTDSPEASEPENTEVRQQPATPSDSLQEALITEQNQADMPQDTIRSTDASLPDTLSIAIVAATDKLEPVRVYTDILGKRNPYWVTQGDTIRFNFVNTVEVRAVNQYDRLQLLFNGHIIQNFFQEYYNDESGAVELSREVFQNHREWWTPAE